MLSRFIFKPSHLRFVSLLSSKPNPITKPDPFPLLTPHFFPKPHHFSTNNGNNNKPPPPDLWNLSSDPSPDSLFPEDSPPINQTPDELKPQKLDSWGVEEEGDNVDDIFKPQKTEVVGSGGGDWGVENAEDAEASWDFSIGADEDGKVEDELFKNVEMEGGEGFELGMMEDKGPDVKQLQAEEKGLMAVLKGPDRAFGDLIAASGITDEMLDSLIALKDLEGIQGLPPLTEIEDLRYAKNTKKSSRHDIELQKQEEVLRARVRQVDSLGRAYGTGRRKCSIARVWIQPGDGKFIVNDKQYDVYFPMLDHRATLLRPFTETKTLGTFDVKCTAKGGGVSGQVGAIRLGISRALQCWDPSLRPPLKAAGFMTRDPRVVERKKPGRAKARKSFQWVKR